MTLAAKVRTDPDRFMPTRRELLAMLGSGALASIHAACSPQSSSPPATIDGPLHYASLSEVGALIEARAISPVELTQMVLERIDSLDGQLHSYLTVTPDRALQAAEAAEQELHSGSYRGPLHGIPLAVKDLCYTHGVRTTGGLAVRASFVPDYDATVVSRLKSAGAIVLGKLNLTEGAMMGYHRDFEIPVNPWDASLSAAGSSSGAGVATAAGLCFGSIGTDTVGSIRNPCTATGVVGLKPTYGLTSRHGVMTLADSLDHVGPMARRVSDVAILLEAIAGHDAEDPTSLSSPVPNVRDFLGVGVEGTRVGFDPKYAEEGVDEGLAGSIRDALGVLEGLGAEMVEVEMPPFPMALAEAFVKIVAFDAVRSHAETYPARADDYGEFLRDFLKFGTSVSESDYLAAGDLRAGLSRDFVEALSQVDVVACPAAGVPWPASGDVGYGTLSLIEHVGDSPYLRFQAPANGAGTPTMTLPCGFNGDGPPYSMQLMGGRLSEATLCRVAHSYEMATEWHARHPKI